MTLVEVKTAELIGPALDWAVATIESETEHVQFSALPSSQHYYAPSRKWAQGGPLIEKHRISTEAPGVSSGFWTASMPGSALMGVCQGPTPLVAGCRRLVREHLGDVVQVPKELLP